MGHAIRIHTVGLSRQINTCKAPDPGFISVSWYGLGVPDLNLYAHSCCPCKRPRFSFSSFPLFSMVSSFPGFQVSRWGKPWKAPSSEIWSALYPSSPRPPKIHISPSAQAAAVLCTRKLPAVKVEVDQVAVVPTKHK